MVTVRGHTGVKDMQMLDTRLIFFDEMQRDVINIYKQLCTADGCEDIGRSLYIDTSKVLFNYREKETTLGNYSFTSGEDQLFYNLYKIIGYTRSIKYGLGHRDQTYAQIMAWWNYYPECAYDAIKHLVKESWFGYWGDIKHFCYFIDKNWNEFNTDDYVKYDNHNVYFYPDQAHPLIKYALEIMAKQLRTDIRALCREEKCKDQVSSAAKWVPQEKSKSFGWIYKMLAIIYNKNIYSKILPDTETIYTRKQMNDIFKKFRKNIVGRLNKFLDPPQIKQCSNDWHKIDFSTVSKQTCEIYNNSFSNITRTGNAERHWFNHHRIECKKNYLKHLSEIIGRKTNMFQGCHMNNNPINEFTTDYELMNLIVSKVVKSYQYNDTHMYRMTENANILNKNFRDKFMKRWNDDVNYDGLKNIIPVLDLDTNYYTGGSNNALYPTMLIFALGARIIENTTYKRGCFIYLTSNGITKWFDASRCYDVFDIVNGLIQFYNEHSENSSCCDEEKSFSLNSIYNDIMQTNIESPKTYNKQDYKLLFLSTKSFTDSEIKMKNIHSYTHFGLFENIMNPLRRDFTRLNVSLPHIVYWNLNNCDYVTTFKKLLNYRTLCPEFKTIEKYDRGQINKNTIYNPLFVRQELSQVSYNIIKDKMSKKQKHELNCYIKNFYSHGINGMKNFNTEHCFRLIAQSPHYDKMDVRFL